MRNTGSSLLLIGLTTLGCGSGEELLIPDECASLISNSYFNCKNLPTDTGQALRSCAPKPADFLLCDYLCGNGQVCHDGAAPPQLAGKYLELLSAEPGQMARTWRFLPNSHGRTNEGSVAGLSVLGAMSGTTPPTSEVENWFDAAVLGNETEFTLYQRAKRVNGDCADYEFISMSGKVDVACGAMTIKSTQERHMVLSGICGLPSDLLQRPQRGYFLNREASWIQTNNDMYADKKMCPKIP